MNDLSQRSNTPRPLQDKSVLAVFPYTPNRIRIRSYEVIRELLQIAQVDVVYLDDGALPNFPPGIRQSWSLPNASKVKRLFRIASGLLGGRPIYHEFYNSSRLIPFLHSVGTDRYSAIYIERLPLHRLKVSHPRIIYDCVDCYSNLTRILGENYPGSKRLLYQLDAMILPRHERDACNAAATVLVSAAREIAQLKQLGVSSQMKVWLPHVNGLGQLRALSSRRKFVLSFHGKLSYSANLLALKELHDQIGPKLDPDKYELRIIGSCSPQIRKRFPGLAFTGFVPVIEEEVAKSDLSILPLRISVGSPNKVLESLAAGVPIITTANVVEGLPNADRLCEAGIYVRTIENFVKQIDAYCSLDIGSRQAISANCREWARPFCDPNNNRQLWQDLING